MHGEMAVASFAPLLPGGLLGAGFGLLLLT